MNRFQRPLFPKLTFDTGSALASPLTQRSDCHDFAGKTVVLSRTGVSAATRVRSDAAARSRERSFSGPLVRSARARRRYERAIRGDAGMRCERFATGSPRRSPVFSSTPDGRGVAPLPPTPDAIVPTLLPR